MNKIIHISKSSIKYKSSIYITASNALNKHINNADIICDGTDDEQQILSAIEQYKNENVGGVIQLSEGNFSISESILMESGIILHGSGQRNTIIEMENPITTQPGIDAITNLDYPNGNVQIEDLAVIMPTTGTTGDAIHAGSGVTIRNVIFGGGTVDTWGIHYENAYKPIIENVGSTSTHQGEIGYPGSNGFWFHQNPDGPNYEAVHYGDGAIRSARVIGTNNDFTAFKFTGAWFDMAIQQITASHVNTGSGVGIDASGLYDCSIVQFDLEGLNICIKAHPIWNCQFMSSYMSGSTILEYLSGGSILFIGGTDPDVENAAVTYIS